MTRTLFTALGLAGFVLATPGAQAAQQCAKREVVVSQLTERYGETRRSVGLSANNTVMEMFASQSSGSWTITVTLPDGMTCLVASGQGYETVAEELPAKGSKI